MYGLTDYWGWNGKAQDDNAMSKTIEIVGIDKLESLREQLDRLSDKADTGNPFLTYEWLITWWRHFGGQDQPLVLIIREGEDILAAAPLMIKKAAFFGLPVTKVQFIGAGEANYLDFVLGQLSEDILADVLDYIRKSYKWQIVDLCDISESSFSLEMLKKGMTDKAGCAVLESEVCPYIAIDTDWESFYQRKLKRKARYNIQRQIKQLQSQGKLEFRRIRQSEDWDFFIREAIKLYRKDWSRKYNLSSFLREESAAFYVDIAREFSRRGWFDFSALFFNEKMIAFSYGITYGKRFVDYVIGYDPEFSAFSPGSCLLRFQIEEMFKQNLKEFDFSKGREPYKSRWQTAERNNYRVLISNKDFYSRLIWALHIIYHRVRYRCKGIYSLRRLRKYLFGRFKGLNP